MASRNPRPAVPLVAANLIVALVLSASASSPPAIWGDNVDAVLFVESVGELYNGTTERETGSGFLISADGLALTANHVTFANKDNYKSVTITVRRATRKGPPLAADFVARDPDHDLAVLQIRSLKNARHVTLGPSAPIPIGARVDVMGFPLTFDQEIVDGIVSSKPSATLWFTNAALNPGHSGAPVFEEANGTVIGVVTGGATTATMPDGSTFAVDGIKHFVPLDVTTLSAHFKVQSWTSGGIRDRVEVSESSGFPSIDRPPPPPPPPPPLARPAAVPRTFSISVMKDDHPGVLTPDTKRYSLNFKADTGYRIASVERVEINSANQASKVEYAIAPDGLQLQVFFTLTSGPLTDQYRSWLDAGVATRQVPLK
jgi:hypothetical protein